MKRINLLIDETMFSHFKQLPGTLTEHIRRAMYEYLQKLHKENTSSSASKRGDKDDSS